MMGKASPYLTRAASQPSANTDSTETATTPARAALLQPPRTSIKRDRDREASGLPEPVRCRSAAADDPGSPAAGSPRTPRCITFAGPMLSPVRAPISAASADLLGSPERPKTQVGFLKAKPPSPTHNAKAFDLLTTKLHRPDLYALATQLDDHLGPGNWAFTGSVALQIHGMALRQGPGRQPGDADVEIDQFKYDCFTREVKRMPSDNGVKNALQSSFNAAGVQEEHYMFDGVLKVDLQSLRPSKIKTVRREVVSGIPVLTLGVLKSLKEGNNGKPTAAADLQRIDTLLAFKGAAAPSQAATAQPRAWKARSRPVSMSTNN